MKFQKRKRENDMNLNQRNGKTLQDHRPDKVMNNKLWPNRNLN